LALDALAHAASWPWRRAGLQHRASAAVTLDATLTDSLLQKLRAVHGESLSNSPARGRRISLPA
jgi:hypothetical protein